MKYILVLILTVGIMTTKAQVMYNYRFTYDSTSITLRDSARNITQTYPLNSMFASRNATSVYLFTNEGTVINRWDTAKNLIYLVSNGNVKSGFDTLQAHIYSTNSAFSCAAVNNCLDTTPPSKLTSYVLAHAFQNKALHIHGNNSVTLVNSSLINKTILFLWEDGMVLNSTFNPKQYTFVSGTGTLTFASPILSTEIIDISYQ